MPLLQCRFYLRTIVAVPAEAIAAMKRIQAFLMLPETEEQQQASEPQAVIVSYSSQSSMPVCNCNACMHRAWSSALQQLWKDSVVLVGCL
jgi:hypothetical protein